MQTLRAREVIHDPELVVIVVESVELRKGAAHCWSYLHCEIAPQAVVVHRPGSTTALDMGAKPASVQQLRDEIPELNAMLARAPMSTTH